LDYHQGDRQFRRHQDKLNMQIGTRIIFSTALAAVLCAFQAASAADTNAATTATLGNPVIARGTGLEITRGDLDDAMTGIKAQTQALTPAQVLQVQKQILNRLIETKLLLARATDADKATGKKMADLQMTALKENAVSPEAYDQRLKTLGMTEADLSAKITREATAQAVLQRELKVVVTDDEVKKYYDGHTADYEQPELARVSHILVFTVDPVTHAALPADQQLSRRRKADDLVKAARGGADFAALAKQYSEDPGSKDNGGLLPPFPRGQMLREIEDAAFSLTNNQVSDVIITTSGYQIVKLLEKIPSNKMGYLAAIADIRQGLTQQKTAQLGAAYLDGLKKAAAVEILDPNLKPAATGGVTVTPATPTVVAPKP
jgi:parvulin-like peptidyl-prolyl isomerase